MFGFDRGRISASVGFSWKKDVRFEFELLEFGVFGKKVMRGAGVTGPLSATPWGSQTPIPMKRRALGHRCPFWLCWWKVRWRLLVYLVV